MSAFELTQFETADALAEAAARQWVQLVETHGFQRHLVALPGGRIAPRLFAAIVELVRGRRLAIAQVHFFWGDERCVPPGDQESNFRVANDFLFSPLGIGSSQIHRIRGELPPGVAAAEAEAELVGLAPANESGLPVLDLVLLGMGEDGHVASLFPGEPEQTTSSRAVFRPVTAPKPPPARITLGYGTLAAARAVWVLASGSGKTEALRRSLQGTSTPLGRLVKLRRSTRILTDVRLS